MNMQQDAREASPRAVEGDHALTSGTRGRSAAPHLSIWLPIAFKAAAAAGIALILAVIGAKAGAHEPSRTFDPAPSATPPVVAAAFMVGLPGTPIAGDAGHAETAPTPAPASPPPASSPGPGLLADGRVVLNEASETDLTKLPGIGPARARAILALRQRLTKFRAVEDLLRVKGIGRKMLRRLRPSVVLDRPAVDPLAGPAVGVTHPPSSPASERVDR
jgi:competence protein ComEA